MDQDPTSQPLPTVKLKLLSNNNNYKDYKLQIYKKLKVFKMHFFSFKN